MSISAAVALSLAQLGTLPLTLAELQNGLGVPEPETENRRSRPKVATGFGQSKKRRGKRKTLEEEFAKEIKAGIIKVVRQRGKPPEIVWL